MPSIKKLIVFVASLSAANSCITESTMAQVMQDVTNIDNSVKILTSQIRDYQGGIEGVSAQLKSLSAVQKALDSGVSDSGLLPATISLTDAFNLVEQVNDTLAIDNPIAVDALISKRKQYKDAGVAPVIPSILQQLLAGHDAFSNHILERIPPGTSPEVIDLGKQVIQVISDALQRGIDAFNEN